MYMSALSAAFIQFCSAFTVLFAAFEKVCKTADHLATVAEESSGAYMDEERIKRASNRRKLETQHGVKLAELEPPKQQVAE
jgi:hypothetical protein